EMSKSVNAELGGKGTQLGQSVREGREKRARRKKEEGRKKEAARDGEDGLPNTEHGLRNTKYTPLISENRNTVLLK
ncbi:MAG: hypothetical protein NZM11_09490, partial [Anaerolineales bacterium]|nr:hypothetical protein [Anaerolineales bacterium]